MGRGERSKSRLEYQSHTAPVRALAFRGRTPYLSVHMKHLNLCPMVRIAASGALVMLVAGGQVLADDAARKPAPPAAAATVGGALPGGAILSARSVTLVPAAGGAPISAPIGSDGTFKLAGLAAGPYRLSVNTTVPKQTQGATFGEKVSAGTAAAGAKSGINGINNGMPNRISMNVSIAKRTRAVEVDGAPIDVEVGSDGILSGRVAAQ